MVSLSNSLYLSFFWKNIILGRRAVPLRVNLPNGTSFVARYKRISRKNLPKNISMSRTRTIGPRNKEKKEKKKKKTKKKK